MCQGSSRGDHGNRRIVEPQMDEPMEQRNAADLLRPRHERFRETVRESFAAQGLMRTLGASLGLVEPGIVEIAYSADPAFCQQHGFMHAGLATAVLDTACGYAALTLAAAGDDVLTAEFKVNFLSPATQPQFLARGRVIRAGRLLSVVEGDVLGFGHAGGQQDGIIRMQATMILLSRERAPASVASHD